MPGETIERAAIRPTVADIEAAADLYKRLMEAERIQIMIGNADGHCGSIMHSVMPATIALFGPRPVGGKLATAISGWLDEEAASVKRQLADLGYDVNVP
jgi:hypothetical protein